MAINPIAFTEKVVSSFLKYQLTTYPLADSDLHRQMRTLLSLGATRRSPLLKGPYISLSRSFQQGANIQHLIQEGIFHPALENCATFPQLYGHQERAIRAIRKGKTTLVSTGTGSGKTECFLYPIISRCFELRDQGVRAGIVAVLVYPMNALAEDQLARLRDLLAGTGITFGMYVGKTPEERGEVVGQHLSAGSSREAYRRTRDRAREERRPTVVYPSEERCSREEMRAEGHQPNILLTNVKQLELLLTRRVDESLFDGARLEYLVFDEAHTFSGAIGAETASLIRRLLAFVGNTPQDTTCVATSATMVDPTRGQKPGQEFASRFFGVPIADVEMVSEQYEADVWKDPRTPNAPLTGDLPHHLEQILRAVNTGEFTGKLVREVLHDLVGIQLDEAKWEESLHEYLSGNEIVFQLAQTLERPRALPELLNDLEERVGRSIPEEELLIWLTLGTAARKGNRPLLRPVVHAFIRGVPGAVVTFPDTDERPRLWLSAEDEEAVRGDEATTRLAVMTCTTCGQHYFLHSVADFEFTGGIPGGGEAVGDTWKWPPLEESLGGRRVVLLDRVISVDEDEEDPHNTAEVFLCRICATLHPREGERCLGCGKSQSLVRLLAVAQKTEFPGRLTRCVSCGSLGRQRGTGYREPARPVRAVNVSDVHVLAQDMVHHAERRRLLVFTDNRQDAAFQAGWMRDHARRFRLRALMNEHILQGPVRVGDLVAKLDETFDRDDELSRTLAAEVWSQHRKDSAPVKHAQERKYFLHIQVLRELTTGVKQRIGLEPWGRLCVKYVGLDNQTPFVVEQAGCLAIPPERLVDGISALLDRIRRTSILLDRETRLFSRFWDEGAREIQMSYFPLIPGVPKGLKLERETGDDPARVGAWLSPSSETIVKQSIRRWGVPDDQIGPFVAALWNCLTRELQILVPITLVGSRGRALPRCAGVHQIDADQLLFTASQGLWRCQTCRRTQTRPTPFDRCLAWRCHGDLEYVPEDPDNYDLALLDSGVQMIRPREHSAQVPASDREFLERAFKGEGEQVNTLVCTPTLELGVDIGALDTVLLRNVPPLPSNYWQRVGRAGRRHRMAVNLTYARAASHDRIYFGQPLRMLEGRIEPPSFNLRNDLMVRKHVHAAILSKLQQLTRTSSGFSESDREELALVLKTVFPKQTKTYLFDDAGQVRTDVFDVSAFRTMVSKHESILLDYVRQIYGQGWPEVDSDVVSNEMLVRYVCEAPQELERVLRALKKRLNWAMDQITRLNQTRSGRGTLDPEEDSLYQRCDRLIKRLKGHRARARRETEGIDDVSTFSVLAIEGFLPGYGLDTGSVLGTAQVPRLLAGKPDLELRRPSALAVREYVPGNRIYANGHRFQPRYYHFEPSETGTTIFQVDNISEAVTEEASIGTTSGAGATPVRLGGATLRAVPVCDVDMTHFSQISDDEETRFQLPVAVYGYELGRHGPGRAYNWGIRDLQFRKGVHFRLVNVGAVSLLRDAERLGFPICLVCGQSRSPFSSQRERTTFEQDHRERCGQSVEPTGFFTDVVADALSFPNCTNREEAYSVLEALRIGAASVLEMEREDLDILVIGIPGTDETLGLLYDPMPGGSGLLDQICARFPEVAGAMLEVVDQCASMCARGCVDCLFTFRNSFFHKHLNRHLAAEKIREWGERLDFSHDVPARLPAIAPTAEKMPVNAAENRLRDLLLGAGFPEAEWQKQIILGRPLGSTTPDCFFPGEDEDDPGVCVYLDGLSTHIHGNPTTAAIDRQIREELRARRYEVFEIVASDLWDREKMRHHFFRLGRILQGKERARELRDNTTWFEGLNDGAEQTSDKSSPFRRVPGEPAERYRSCIPLLTLKAAAGGFGSPDGAETLEWVEPNTTRRLREGMFIAQVVGHSMEPLIPDGAYCLFSSPVVGSRTGRILLVQHRDISDPETGGTFTVKKFDSSGIYGKDTTERTGTIYLRPLNPDFQPIELKNATEDNVRAIAEFLDVLEHTNKE